MLRGVPQYFLKGPCSAQISLWLIQLLNILPFLPPFSLTIVVAGRDYLCRPAARWSPGFRLPAQDCGRVGVLLFSTLIFRRPVLSRGMASLWCGLRLSPGGGLSRFLCFRIECVALALGCPWALG